MFHRRNVYRERVASPIPRHIKDTCRAALPALLAAHGLDSSAPIVQDEQGWVNPCYFVGDDLVVRFNSRDPEQPKFTRETVAFDHFPDEAAETLARTREHLVSLDAR